MLVVNNGTQDAFIRDLPSYLKAGDVMVFNDTRVIPARLFGKRITASIELLLHKHLSNDQWQCFARPGKKLRAGDRIAFADDFSADVIEKLDDGQVIVAFNVTGMKFWSRLAEHGQMPLPPYIEKKRRADRGDDRDYQTVYAKHDGSVAAPTAGLHFTDELLAAIDAMGVKRAHVTLHVGGGTFLPVKTEDTSEHVMHSEWAQLSPETASAINDAKRNGGRIIAVGTTSLRTLESACDASGQVQPFEGETNIFITPGYRFKTADILLTNFHLPRSTLFMLVSAFSGLEAMQGAYAHAISKGYRFYSYGDGSLLFRA